MQKRKNAHTSLYNFVSLYNSVPGICPKVVEYGLRKVNKYKKNN